MHHSEFTIDNPALMVRNSSFRIGALCGLDTPGVLFLRKEAKK